MCALRALQSGILRMAVNGYPLTWLPG